MDPCAEDQDPAGRPEDHVFHGWDVPVFSKQDYLDLYTPDSGLISADQRKEQENVDMKNEEAAVSKTPGQHLREPQDSWNIDLIDSAQGSNSRTALLCMSTSRILSEHSETRDESSRSVFWARVAPVLVSDDLLFRVSVPGVSVELPIRWRPQKIGDIEEALNDSDGRLTAVEKLCSTLQTENTSLKLKLDDLENRSRRQNLRVIGIPEGSEGQSPQSAFSRHMLVRLHHYQTKELILKLSRELGSGAVVRIFPDMSAEVARRRAEFKDVKTALRNAGITYGMLHPARLRVDFQGQRHLFQTPQAAMDFVSTVIKSATSKD
ncbi:unnamed protein product [Leuciscus chuanchicus]